MHNILSRNPTQAVLALAGVLFAAVLVTALFVGGDVVIVGMIAGSFLGLGVAMYRGSDRLAEVGAATALIGQAIGLTAAFQGHPWQVDTHMVYFALLACLIVLRSIPAILMATVVTAVHHLSLSFFLPALVFPSGELMENLARTVFHAVIVLMETGVLVVTVVLLKRLDQEAQKQHAELTESVHRSQRAGEEAEKARQAAEAMQEQAKADQARTEQLLREAKEAEKLRVDAEAERLSAQEKTEQIVRATAEEQAEVVGRIRDAMHQLKGGDLTTRIDGQLPEAYRDVAVAFNEAVAALDATVGQVSVQAEDMQAQVLGIASATADLAKRTESQAQMLRESSEGLEELTRVVSKTEDTVKEADASAQSAQSSARSSETVVTETSKAMSAIQTEAEEISQIVKVIDEIAFQTNLLALNAGVEAARAGDAGRGFAVVASEVRALAQRSSESATNIRGLIERSGQQVEAGSAKIEETVGSLNAVLEAVLEITARTGKIAEGAQEQTSGISELNRKVAHLDNTTQQNAAMFEETSAACTSLQASAERLEALTRKFLISDVRAGDADLALLPLSA